MDTIIHSHQRWMDGWMDTKTRVDKQTYRKADRVNPWTITNRQWTSISFITQWTSISFISSKLKGLRCVKS